MMYKFEYPLQLASQANLDVAAHIVSDNRLGEPRAALIHRFRCQLESGHMAGFRNVHGYDEVDLDIIPDILTNHLKDLTSCTTTIRQKLT